MSSISMPLKQLTLLAAFVVALANAQYNQGYGASKNGARSYPAQRGYNTGNSGYNSAYYNGEGYSSGDGGSDRPNVQLGLRLRIPAFRFEMPRFSLPKITVSAKIRQPDRPRIITLPEINFDSNAAKDNGAGGGSNYGGSSNGGSKYGANYGGYNSAASSYGGPEREQTFSFSTYEDEIGGSYGGSSKKANYGSQMRQQGYSSTNLHPSYSSISGEPSQASAYGQRMQRLQASSGSSELGFNAPAYVKYQQQHQQPIDKQAQYESIIRQNNHAYEQILKHSLDNVREYGRAQKRGVIEALK